MATNAISIKSDAGLNAATPLTKVYDLNGAFGGPIKKDRVWYFVSARTQGSTRAIASVYYNQNAGDPTKWLYVPDLSRQITHDSPLHPVGARLTWAPVSSSTMTIVLAPVAVAYT